jgi:uncharacterized protein involved in response to NO
VRETTAEQIHELPEVWQAAYARDKLGAPDYADPGPERRAAKALAFFILSGLVFLALPGTFLGVWNLILISSHRVAGAASTAWIQAHGHAQLFGWVGTFILGISLYVLPKFRGRSPKRFGNMWAVGVLWVAGVAWRWWTGVSGMDWRLGLVASAVLELAAYALSQYVLLFGAEKKANGRNLPADLGSWLGLAGFGALGVALVMNLVISLELALHGTSPVYPPRADRAFLLVALWGFTVPVAWGYSTRFVTVFLGLRPPLHRAGPWLCAAVALLVISALAGRFLLADFLALAETLAAIWTLRVYHPNLRPPKVIGVYRRYPQFVLMAFAWLAIGAALGLAADLAPDASGLGGASRHAVTVGFLATLIFAIGPRILPAFLGGRELAGAGMMAAALWLLNAGCLLRVSSEAVAYSAGGLAWKLLPVSALLELGAVTVFVINLGLTLARPMPAWFTPDGVKPSLTLYWYVTSFPETRDLLISSGIRTLAKVRHPPRTLTLAEAAEADAADVDRVLARLRDFFGRRQPLRAGR